MGIISWVQCTLREGFCLGWLNMDAFLENLLGGSPRSRSHPEPMVVTFCSKENYACKDTKMVPIVKYKSN